MIELSDAQAFVHSRISVLEPEEYAVARARGCVIAATVRAQEAVPGFANSSMDGFALRARDTVEGGVRLRVVDSLRAGEVSSVVVGAGQAVRIMTGAALPEGADCVCMIEEATVEGSDVVIARTLTPGAYVRGVGEDTEVGQVLFSPGDVLSAAGVGVLAGQGVTSVAVHPRARVGVLSTGHELVTGAGPLGPGQIRDLNRPMLLALVREAGFVAVDLDVADDTPEDITRALRGAITACDAVITTGGVSVGDVDFVKTVLAELGGDDARWMQVAIKPAKPFAFAVVGPRRVPVFGLPGNPVSTRVSFELFVRPALRARAGHRVLERPTLDAILDVALERPADDKIHLVHVRVAWGDDGALHVTDAMRRGSHLLHAVAAANALAVVPTDARAHAGERVRVIVLDTDSLGAAP